ncbi:hypothetical protein XH99_07560 [Bradyrhizobium nanningense]|uniref:Uncharacterized protein n=1 Tax=Bradyrhizobium nanningense TaxID=1325118 RepID=A0A4Q0SDA6_9BRAD|nr:hypothetical protein [Bradyrhizobium nanningense]RXH35590.1 hypothetical protein XH99_07560 [Bradyrhizobium nanningense]RXH36301.1 hypothetical protein XH84_03530 [Bradyrhizobium nanningense]
MKRRTLGALLAGGLFAATAAMAIPVTPDPARDSPTNTIQISWSHTTRSNGYVDDTWWATRDRCAPDYLGERLLCDAVGLLARTTSRTFEVKMSQDMGLPLADRWGLMTAKNSPFIRSAHVETPLGLEAVLGFYRAALEKRGWTENDGAVVEADRAVVAFTTSDGPALLRLVRQDHTTIADLALRKPLAATALIRPAPGQVRLLLGNKMDEAADITVNERTIRLAAHAGEKLVDSDDAADKLPDSQKIDLLPGKYRITLQLEGSAAQQREFEVAANETWGLLVGPAGAPLPIRLY